MPNTLAGNHAHLPARVLPPLQLQGACRIRL
jgi:hypothetical protein